MQTQSFQAVSKQRNTQIIGGSYLKFGIFSNFSRTGPEIALSSIFLQNESLAAKKSEMKANSLNRQEPHRGELPRRRDHRVSPSATCPSAWWSSVMTSSLPSSSRISPQRASTPTGHRDLLPVGHHEPPPLPLQPETRPHGVRVGWPSLWRSFGPSCSSRMPSNNISSASATSISLTCRNLRR